MAGGDRRLRGGVPGLHEGLGNYGEEQGLSRAGTCRFLPACDAHNAMSTGLEEVRVTISVAGLPKLDCRSPTLLM